MKPVSTVHSRAVPLLHDSIDTDTIIPSREIRNTGRSGLEDGLFAPWRYLDPDLRVPDPQFVLNQPDARGARLLLGGKNFGCGSSREHAVWALVEFGVEAIIAPSFAPIFRSNCVRNGLLPIELDAELVRSLAWKEVAVDLRQQTVGADGVEHRFEIDPEARLMLLNGYDEIDLTLSQSEAIDAWINTDRLARPWVYAREPA